MKKLIASIIIVLFATVAFAVDITFTIPNDKVDRVKDPLFAKYPKIACVSHPTGTPCEAEPTDLEHFKSIVINIIKGDLQDIERDTENKRVRAERNAIVPVLPTDYDELFQ